MQDILDLEAMILEKQNKGSPDQDLAAILANILAQTEEMKKQAHAASIVSLNDKTKEFYTQLAYIDGPECNIYKFILLKNFFYYAPIFLIFDGCEFYPM